MTWRLEFTAQAAKAFTKLEPGLQKRLQQALHLLLEDLEAKRNPLRGDHKPLTNRPGERRLRVGDWRVVYRLEHGRLVVLVIGLGHRSAIS